MYSKQETILLPIFMRRLLRKPFPELPPLRISVKKHNGYIHLTVILHSVNPWDFYSCKRYESNMTSLATYYGLKNVRVWGKFTQPFAIGGAFTMFPDFTTKGQLKLKR